MAKRKSYAERARETQRLMAQRRAKATADRGGDPFQDFLEQQAKQREKLATPEQKSPTPAQAAQTRFADVQAGGGDAFQDFLSQAQKAEETRKRAIPRTAEQRVQELRQCKRRWMRRDSSSNSNWERRLYRREWLLHKSARGQ